MKFKEDTRGRFITITGRDIDPSLFDKIVALDSEVFSEDSTDFQADTSMPEDVLKSYLEKNILTTTIIYDRKEDKVVGYFQAFPLEKEFAQDYIDGKKHLKILLVMLLQLMKMVNHFVYMFGLLVFLMNIEERLLRILVVN